MISYEKLNMWFEDLFGFAEQSPEYLRQHLSRTGTRLNSKAKKKSFDCGTLEIPTLEDLRTNAAAITRDSTERATLTQLVGNVQNLNTVAEDRRSIFEVASQFNLLEMAAPELVPEGVVGIYE